MVRSREISARELLADHLARVDEVNPALNAVVAIDPEVAEARAAVIDETVAAGRRPGPLAGLVTAHKDMADTVDFVTTYGSPAYAGHRPKVDALLVERMKAAGAVAIGKTNTPELGAGSHTFNPVYGLTRNPWDPDRSAGGSSGGAAVALRTGMVSIADGSDLGGSLRNPAAWNNVIGFRGTARTVPRRAVGNAWNPLPIEGPMARSIDDLVLLLRVLTPAYDADPLSRPLTLPPVVSPPSRSPRVAWSRDLGGLPVDPAIREVLDTFRADLDLLGWDVVDDEPDFAGADECFVTLRAFLFVERAAALGDRVSEAKATVQDEIERGLALTAHDVALALAHLNVLWRRSIEFFDRYDLLIAPVTQIPPFPADQEYPTEVAGRPMGSYIEWMRSCCRITTTGCPALSLPAGFTADGGPGGGLPVGAQIVGRPGGDVALLEAAKALEATTGHGHRWPPPDLRSRS
jgi:amidase